MKEVIDDITKICDEFSFQIYESHHLDQPIIASRIGHTINDWYDYRYNRDSLIKNKTIHFNYYTKLGDRVYFAKEDYEKYIKVKIRKRKK